MSKVNKIEINVEKLRQNYMSFAKFGKVYFPVKTCSNDIVLNVLKDMESGFEVDSIDHMKKVLTDKNADKIIYSNVAKSEEDIDWALSHHVTFYTIDDENTLDKIIYYAQKYHINNLKINVRLNVYDIFRRDFIKKGIADSRLGSSVGTLKKLLKKIREESGIKISAGISFYVQAEMHDKEDMLLVVAKYILKHFDKEDKIEWINIGGGSRIRTLEKHYDSLMRLLNKLGIEKIILEPGRYMVESVMRAYVPPIRCVSKDNGEVVVTLGMGIYHGLMDIKLHKREFDIYLLAGDKKIKLNKIDHIKRVVTKSSISKKMKTLTPLDEKLILRGPTADSIDIIGVYETPKNMPTESDAFLIDNIGAYVEGLISDFSGKIDIEYIVKNSM